MRALPMISEFQQVRVLGRLLAVQIRLEILDGRADPAIHWLQVGFAMARHVGSGDRSMIAYLVGSADHDSDGRHSRGSHPEPRLRPTFTGRWRTCPGRCSTWPTPTRGRQYVLEKEFPRLRDLENRPVDTRARPVILGRAGKEDGDDDG